MAILGILKILSQKEKYPNLYIISMCYGAFCKFTRKAMRQLTLFVKLKFITLDDALCSLASQALEVH